MIPFVTTPGSELYTLNSRDCVSLQVLTGEDEEDGERREDGDRGPGHPEREDKDSAGLNGASNPARLRQEKEWRKVRGEGWEEKEGGKSQGGGI